MVTNYTHQSYHPVDLQVSLGREKSLLARGCQFLFPVFHVRVLELETLDMQVRVVKAETEEFGPVVALEVWVQVRRDF